MSTDPERPNAEPRPTRTRPARRALLVGASLAALAALLASSAIAALPGPAAPTAPTAHPALAVGSGPAPPAATNSSWAWGALANATIEVDFVGAANTSSGLTGGNLTVNGAFLALHERLHEGLALYAIVNASTPSAGHRYVTVAAAELRALSVQAQATGSFPKAGNYSANQTIPLVPLNVSLNASVSELQEYAAYLNFTTSANGSLGLVDEHLVSRTEVSVSFAASNFPNITRNATTGITSVKYASGAFSITGYTATDLTATFQPALLLVDGPLTVGKSWTTNSTVSFHGTKAYAVAFAAAVPGGATASASQAGQAQVNATVPVSLTCTVVGTQNVTLPDGSNETDYVIAVTNANGTSGGVWVANGLLLELASANTSPATGSSPVPAASEPTSRTLYSPHRALPDSQQATPQGGSQVTAATMSPGEAHTLMGKLGQPTAPASAGGTNGLGALLVLLAAIAGIGAVVWELRRVRRARL
jgi:hypothetical protein